MPFKTADDGHVYNDDKKNSGSHHGSVRPGTGLKLKKVNEKKSTDRSTLVKELMELSPKIWMKDGAEFGGGMYEGSIWTGEGSELKNGDEVFTYPQQVHKDFQKILDKNKWYAEWYDNGTVFLVPTYYGTAKTTDDDFPTPTTEKLSLEEYNKKMMHEFMSDPENKSQFDAILAGLKEKGVVPPKK